LYLSYLVVVVVVAAAVAAIIITAPQKIKNQLKSSTENEKTEELKSTPMHAHFYRDLQRSSVDN